MQLEVAMKSGYSQRHVSFLELGRASPSREAVLVLASHRPFPAILVDRAWNMFDANECAMALFEQFMDVPGPDATLAELRI